MSTRTHAPECAKTRQLKVYEENGPERTPVTAACTCSAEYQPSVEERLAQAERERDEARAIAEDGFRYGIERGEDPEEMCPPWVDLDLWLTQCGRLADLDHDEMCIEDGVDDG